ncbi:hypothetical protein L0244_36240, partial [bacterium]|nr:hypothetical protein [bacterium]
SLAFAAWWNPLTWFKKEPSAEVSSETSINEESAELRERINLLEQKLYDPETQEAAIDETLETIVQEKIVTQTIRVDDPELQKKIDALLAENQSLKLQVTNSQKKLSEIQSNLTTCLKSPTTSSSDKEEKRKYEVAIAELEKLIFDSESLYSQSRQSSLLKLAGVKTVEGVYLFGTPKQIIQLQDGSTRILVVSDFLEGLKTFDEIKGILNSEILRLKVELAKTEQ